MNVPDARKQRQKIKSRWVGGADHTRVSGPLGRSNGPGFALTAALLLCTVGGWGQQPGAAPPPDAGLGAPAAAGGTSPAPSGAPVPAGTFSSGDRAVSSAGPVSSSGGVDNSRYLIGSDDVLQVTVWKEPTLSGTIPVRPDGMISLVLLGDVPATGMTPMQLGTSITERLKKYIQDPSVTIVVTAVNSQKIYMIGEVQHVGAVTLSPGMSPLQAISAAGGLTNFANGKRIYILRGPAGKQEKIPFNYKQALKGDARQMPVLHPGDTVVVP